MNVRLPYRKALNRYLLYYAGLVLFGFLIRETPTAGFGTADLICWLHLGLFCFTLLCLTPLVRFRHEGKVAPEQALLRIPVLKLYVWCIAGGAGVFVWTGLLNEMDSLPSGRWLALKSGLVATVLLLALNHRRILFRDDLIPAEVARELAARKSDKGQFRYSDEGFSHHGPPPFHCLWEEIRGIFAYKTDNYTVDTVHLLLKKETGAEWTLHEDTAGWFVFIERLEAHLPGVNPVWQLEVIGEPFATNATLVYEKGRDLRAEWGADHPQA